MDLKTINSALGQLEEERGIPRAKVIEAIEMALAAAYRKEYGKKGQIVKACLDIATGKTEFEQVKVVVDESMLKERPTSEEDFEAEPQGEGDEKVYFNEEHHIMLEDARKIRKDVKVGEELVFPLETKEDFGRIAAQAAKQAVFQRLRESERDSILNEWRGKEGQIVSGAVQRFERGHVYIDLGRAVGVMFANESVPGEHYRTGERLRFLVVAVQEDTRLPGIILSRSHPKFVSKLFELEVPEVAEGAVEVKLIAREPGSRTKIAVVSNVQGVDPVGALVGQRGTRVMAVNNELGQEKIDIIEWADDPAAFIANSLSPAKAKSVEILPRREARVYVPEDQLSLAIGRGGQNVRLAAKLTGWKIDVRSDRKPEEQLEGGVAGAVESDEGMPSQFPEEKDSAAEE